MARVETSGQYSCVLIVTYIYIYIYIYIYTTGKKYGIVLFQRFCAYLRGVHGVSVLEIHSYEYILLLG